MPPQEKGLGSSADMRKIGNETYLSCKEGLQPAIYASRLAKAISYYQKVVITALERWDMHACMQT
jgi:hypothetical protein